MNKYLVVYVYETRPDVHGKCKQKIATWIHKAKSFTAEESYKARKDMAERIGRDVCEISIINWKKFDKEDDEDDE